MLLPEWAEAKAAAATALAEGAEVEDEDVDCKLQCQNPQRYGLPCRHWMFKAAVTEKSIPQSLIHPRWFYNEPAIPRGRWRMTYSHTPAPTATTAQIPPPASLLAIREDPYRQHGGPMLESKLLRAQELHRSLTGQEAEEYASAIRLGLGQVAHLQEERRKRRSALPIEAPRNPAPTWERGGKKRERAITGVDLAEQQEREDSRQRRQQQREAQLVAEPEPDQDQDINFLHIDDIIEEVDMSQPHPPPALAPASSVPYATPEAPEYSQLTQPLQLGSPPAQTPIMSSHTPANPRSCGLAGPPPTDIGCVRGAATAAAKPKRRRPPKEKTEEVQRLDSLKATAKAANAEAKVKMAAARKAEEGARAQRKAAAAARKEAERKEAEAKKTEERKTAKELAAKRRKNQKESQPLAEQTQQAGFSGVELPFRSSQ